MANKTPNHTTGDHRPRRRDASAAPVAHATPGVIEPDCLYVMDEARRRLRWTKAAYRSALRHGLRVLRSGKRAYLYGADIVAFIRSTTPQE